MNIINDNTFNLHDSILNNDNQTWLIKWNSFFSSSGCVDTAVWMHYMDAN